MRNKALRWILVASLLMVTASTAQQMTAPQSPQLDASRHGQVSMDRLFLGK
ncbi:MAG TPA: hypothetical protein VKR57_11895 [Terriglobales bacterium]|nr:hypothetical protein [Terriglobales bacterium]